MMFILLGRHPGILAGHVLQMGTAPALFNADAFRALPVRLHVVYDGALPGNVHQRGSNA